MGIIDSAFGGVTSKSLSSSNISLSISEAQASILRFSGAISANITVTLPAIIKSWVIENLTTGAFTVTLTGGSGQVLGLPPGSCQAYWDGTNAKFMNLGRVGQYWDHAVAAVPAWITACTVPPALNCDGTAFSAVTYPLLNQILGTTTLPDSKGRLRAALDQSSSRITTAGSGIDGTTRFSAGGAQSVTILQANLPAVTLATTITDPGHSHPTPSGMATFLGTAGTVTFQCPDGVGHAFNSNANTATNTTGITASTALGGSGTATNKMPPTFIHGLTLIWAN